MRIELGERKRGFSYMKKISSKFLVIGCFIDVIGNEDQVKLKMK